MNNLQRNNSDWPKISIITPSYNQGIFIEETILSVLDQNYPNLEYIIMDGGSTDNTVDIIKKYEDRITYWISEKDNGQSDAINKGFHKSTGDILHWLNSDDVLVPRALNMLVEYLSNNPDIGCFLGDQEIIDKDSNFLSLKKAIPYHLKTAIYSACMVSQPATPFTRKAWEKTGDVNNSLQYQMDFEYYLRMFNSGVKFGVLGSTFARFRIYSESKTISEYDNLVWGANRIIQEPYLPEKLKKSASKDKLLKIFNYYYRMRSYVVRAFLRGEVIPFKGAKARRLI